MTINLKREPVWVAFLYFTVDTELKARVIPQDDWDAKTKHKKCKLIHHFSLKAEDVPRMELLYQSTVDATIDLIKDKAAENVAKKPRGGHATRFKKKETN